MSASRSARDLSEACRMVGPSAPGACSVAHSSSRVHVVVLKLECVGAGGARVAVLPAQELVARKGVRAGSCLSAWVPGDESVEP